MGIICWTLRNPKTLRWKVRKVLASSHAVLTLDKELVAVLAPVQLVMS